MANYCDFIMRITGNSAQLEQMKEYFNHSNLDQNETKRFFRVYENSIYNETDTEFFVEGYCAWSVENCFICSSPYDDFLDIVSCSRELKLAIEIRSLELGCAFTEHYVIKNGTIEIDQSADFDYDYFYDEDDELRPEKETEYNKLLEI